MGTPDQDGKAALGGEGYTTSIGLESTYSGSVRHCAVILDTGASANLVGANRLNNRNAILMASGRPSAFASFRYGDSRVGDVRRAAVTLIGIAGYTGHFLAYVVVRGWHFLALPGKEAFGTLGRHFNFRERVLALEPLGADIPLEMSAEGRHLLSVADSPGSDSAGTPDRRTNGCVRRAANDKGAL